MSHMIPPMVSTTPPPLGDPHEEEEEEEDFGDFASADYPFQIDGDENESPHHLPVVKDPWPPLENIHDEVPQADTVTLEVTVNGTSENHEVTDEEVEEELKRCDDAIVSSPPDNTSQDSVVSANTDSGLCSASEDASPLPPTCTESTDLPELSSSASDETLVWTNHIVAPSLDSNSSLLSNSSLADTSSTVISSNTTVPALSSQSINITCDDDDESNCDLISNTIQSEEDFGDFENGVSSVNSIISDFSNSELSSTIKNEGVPLSDLANEDFGDHTNATSNISLSSLPTDLSPTLTENSSNPLDTSDNFQSIAVNQTNTIHDDTLSFGDFESVSSDVCTNTKTDNIPDLSLDKSKEYDNLENNSSSFDNNDDFGDFESVSNQTSDINFDSNKDNISLLNQDTSSVEERAASIEDVSSVTVADSTTADDDFGDFEVAPESEDIVEPWAESKESEDDFADFGSTSQSEGWATQDFTETASSSTAVQADDDDDDFDDFESAISSTPTPQPLGADLVALVTQLFPATPTVEVEDQVPPPLTNWLPAEKGSSSIWPMLRDVQSTPALDYQWSSSCSHKCMLGALGIDSRNILFGQRWNANMPRFAANLGQSPLEPVRADMLASSSHSPSIAGPGAEQQQECVPAAQFDWTGSGLVNPLDSASKQAEEAALHQKKLMQEVQENHKKPEVCSKPELILDASELSASALRIITSMPDLSYMRAGQLTNNKCVP